MTKEQIARANHKSGCNCGQSVFLSFADAMALTPEKAMQLAPRPRAEGGQCGAFLAGRELLARLKPEAVDAYVQRFIELNGASECRRLRGKGKSCNDYVGDAARLAEELLG